MGINVRIYIVSVFLQSVSTACRFGSDPSCAFVCNCEDPLEACDRDTGACPQSGCRRSLPAGYGWGGTGCLVDNVAYGKPATQSGDYSNDYGTHYASRSVDGNTNPYYSAGSCSHTEPGHPGRAWWQVDLGALHVIHNVTIYNTRMVSSRTSNLAILVGPTEDDLIECAHLDQEIPASGHQTFPCPSPLVGRFIKLLKDSGVSSFYNMLTICEFIAMGHIYLDCSNCSSACTNLLGCERCPQIGKRRPRCKEDCTDGTYGQDCALHCPGKCQCNVISGQCDKGCYDWYIGDSCTTSIGKPGITDETLAVYNYNGTAVGITWEDSFDKYDAKYYFYIIEYSYLDGQFSQNETIPGDAKHPIVISTYSGIEYSFRVVPYRNMSKSNGRVITEAGQPSQTVTVITETLPPPIQATTSANMPRPATTPLRASTHSFSSIVNTPSLPAVSEHSKDISSKSYPDTIVIVMGAIIGVLALVLIGFIVAVVVLRRRQTQNRSNAHVYYNTNSHRGNKDVTPKVTPSAPARQNLDDPGSTYTTPDPAYSMNQVSEYEELPTPNTGSAP